MPSRASSGASARRSPPPTATPTDPPRRAGRLPWRRLLLPLDLLLAAVALALLSPPAALAARLFRRPGGRHLLLFSPGASLDFFEKTLGDYWWYLDSHGAGGAFERVTVFFYPFPARARTVRREAGGTRFAFVERPPLGGALHLCAAALLVAEAVWRAREGAAVVRGMDMYFHGLLAWATARLAGRPMAISVHSDYQKYADISGRPTYAVLPFRRPLAWTARFVFGRADRVWAISSYIREACVRDGCPREKIRVVYHAVPTSDEAPAAEGRAFLERAGLLGRPYVAFAGRLDREKRVFDCVEVAAALRRLRPDALVAVAGDGPDRADLEAEVARRGLGDAVRILGRVEHRMIPALFRGGVAFIPIAGFTLVDAALAGAPVVAYAVEWHGELIEDGATGRLVPEGDAAGVAAAAADLLARPAEAARLGAALRALAETRHTPAAHARAAASFYDELLGARRSA